MQDAEDNGAGDSEDEHEQALTEEPFADFALSFFQGAVEAGALVTVKEREEELVGMFAFEHEVDAEEGGGEDVEDVGEPVGQRGEEIRGGGGEAVLGALCEGVDAKSVRQGKSVDFGNDAGDALGQVGGEVAEIAEDRRKSAGKEGSKEEAEDDDEDDDGDGAGGMVATDSGLPDAVDDGHQNDGEEGAHVENLDLFDQIPGEGEEKQDENGEEDVAVDCGAGSLLVWREFRGVEVGD